MGEEYVGLVQVTDQENRIIPSTSKRFAFTLLESFRDRLVDFIALVLNYFATKAGSFGYYELSLYLVSTAKVLM